MNNAPTVQTSVRAPQGLAHARQHRHHAAADHRVRLRRRAGGHRQSHRRKRRRHPRASAQRRRWSAARSTPSKSSRCVNRWAVPGVAAMSAEVLGAWGEFDRAAQEHADADSRASAARFAHARSALDRRARQISRRNRAGCRASCRASSPNTRTTPTRWCSRAASRRELLTRYSGLLTGMDMRVRTSIEQAWKTSSRVAARDPLLEVRAQLDAVRAAFAARGAFDARELDTGPLAGAERTLAATLRERRDGVAPVTGSGLVPRHDRRRAGADDHACCPLQERGAPHGGRRRLRARVAQARGAVAGALPGGAARGERNRTSRRRRPCPPRSRAPTAPWWPG